MRPTIDLAYRARNWFWYWRVREISGLSNEQLDKKCFGDTGRRRHFERIQASASGPNDVAIINGQTLLTIVDNWDRPSKNEPGPYAIATQEFHSQLWNFLATRDLASSVYTDFIQQYAEEQGWLRVTHHIKGLYKTFLGNEEPAIEYGVSTAYSAMLHKLVNDASPDSAAVVIALFREAMHRVELEKAMSIKIALRASILWMGECLSINEDVISLINVVSQDRILSNHWVSETDWRKNTNTPFKSSISTRERVRDFQSWVKWYIKRSAEINRNDYGDFPLVPSSERTDWVDAHQDFLTEVQKEFYSLRNTYENLRHSKLPENQQMAEDARVRANGLLSHIRPPISDPVRFYTTRPNLEIGKLPRAY